MNTSVATLIPDHYPIDREAGPPGREKASQSIKYTGRLPEFCTPNQTPYQYPPDTLSNVSFHLYGVFFSRKRKLVGKVSRNVFFGGGVTSLIFDQSQSTV